MKSLLQQVGRARTGWSLFFLSLLLAVTGCSSGSGLLGVPSPSQNPPAGPPPLPSSDAGLAEHVSQQVVIGYVPGAQLLQVVREIKGTVLREFKQHSAVVVGLPQGVSIVDTIRVLQGISSVKYAEPNYVTHLLLIPNDPFFATKQWGPQRINAPAAWDITTGNANSVVAVVDSGVSSTHPEFSGKLLTGTNCVSGGSTDDDNGHGTHVAGIAAAIGNNGAGIAGISWGSSVLPIKSANSAGVLTTVTETCGIDFGATFASSNPTMRVVENLSWGGPAYSQLVKDAVDFALQSGVVVVASAGNDGKATVLFPAGYPGVMAVGATIPSGARATFSTYGSHLSVAAPGVDIYSTFLGTGYAYETGTSMAAPHVSGVVALVRAVNPSLTPAQVRSQIEQTATRSGGFDPQLGWGVVNAAAAVGATVAGNYGKVQVTVMTVVGAVPGGPVDVIVWIGTPACSALTQVVQTAKTGTVQPGVAVFSEVPAGSYCVTASEAIPPAGPPLTGATPSPFTVVPGMTTSVTMTIM